jgi:large subunit ribosomal protein L6
MSRIGKMPIIIPDKVQVDVSKGNFVTVVGPKGKMSRQLDPELSIKVEGNIISVDRPNDQRRHRSMHGLTRSLINNMVVGVSEGYTIEQELVGVGYKANALDNRLELAIGYSHDIIFIMPDEVTVTTETLKGKNPKIILHSHDKELVGLIAAKIRAFRKPEPYKGKGIKYVGETLRRKAGKTAAGQK